MTGTSSKTTTTTPVRLAFFHSLLGKGMGQRLELFLLSIVQAFFSLATVGIGEATDGTKESSSAVEGRKAREIREDSWEEMKWVLDFRGNESHSKGGEDRLSFVSAVQDSLT